VSAVDVEDHVLVADIGQGVNQPVAREQDAQVQTGPALAFQRLGLEAPPGAAPAPSL
jgi:hypothetical protein